MNTIVNDRGKMRQINEKNARHGGPYDRGSADRYYGRPFTPHYYEGGTYQGDPITEEHMTQEEIESYHAGWGECEDKKDWGFPEELSIQEDLDEQED